MGRVPSGRAIRCNLFAKISNPPRRTAAIPHAHRKFLINWLLAYL